MRLRSFEETVAAHQRRVYTLARYLLGEPADAEDVVQEVWIKLWRHQSELDRRGMAAWLTRVTRNACYDRLRQRRSAGRYLEPAGDDGTVERAPDEAPDPEARSASRDFRQRVEAELRRLDEPYRSILILREVQGLKYREIADAMKMPLNTVRVYLHRGRRRVRERLKEMRGDAGRV